MGGLLLGQDEISQHLASANLPDRDKCWGRGEGRAVKEEDLHNLPLLISVYRKQDLPRTLWCSFPSSLHHPWPVPLGATGQEG